jgi:ribonuclease HII
MRAIMAAGSRLLPSTTNEEALWAAGSRFVAGVDEVGRGPLAGPVFAAAVILNPDAHPDWVADLRDSKVIDAAERERLAIAIRAEALAFSLGWATVSEIDAWGISTANKQAMARALLGLRIRPQWALIDGPIATTQPLPQKAIVDGDATCASIAAASIVAKVARDALMTDLDRVFPQYGFASHKGYATAEHLTRLQEHGACIYHRRSWLAVRRHAGLEIETPSVAAVAAR